LLGAIISDVKPPHLNSLARKLTNNREQWDKLDDHSIEIKDRLADKEKDAGESDSGDD